MHDPPPPPSLPNSLPPNPPKGQNRGCSAPPPPRLLPGNVLGWASVKEEGGPHGHPRRSRQDQIQSARGGTWLCLSPPFFRGPAVVWVRRARWCCCYKYAAASPSKWQLYSGARTRCLGAVGASRSKKGKPSVAALVDMYLCTWAVDVRSDGSFRLGWSPLTHEMPPC